MTAASLPLCKYVQIIHVKGARVRVFAGSANSCAEKRPSSGLEHVCACRRVHILYRCMRECNEPRCEKAARLLSTPLVDRPHF